MGQVIGLVDVDLIDALTNFPNLALMKISASEKQKGNETRLAFDIFTAAECSKLYASKVFTFSNEPDWLRLLDVPVLRGGTGYAFDKAQPLPDDVEHARPDYELYRDYIEELPRGPNGLSVSAVNAYLKASIGFTTRGCFRRCSFCVNRHKTRVVKWSPISEFVDPSRPYIFLLDDNVFGCLQWREIFDELAETGKRVSYRQGLDLRLMDAEKAQALARLKYYKDVCFAFDNVADKPAFERGADRYREYCDKETQAYVLTGFYKSGLDEIRDFVERVNVCKRYEIYPFVMKHDKGQNDVYAPIFTQAARFYNQRRFSSRGNLLEFIRRYGSAESKHLIDEDRALRNELDKLRT